MDKYTIDALKAMLCAELDDLVRRGIKTHEDLDIVKDATEALKNLEKIEKHHMEEGLMEWAPEKYSQRRGNYMMDDFARRNSYNYYDDDMAFRRGGNSGIRDGGGNSRAYSPYMMARGYSGTGTKEEVMQELHQIIDTTTDEKVKSAVLECVTKMEKII